MKRITGGLLAVLLVLGAAGCSLSTGDGEGGPTGGGGGTTTATSAGRLPDVTLEPLRDSGRAVDLGRLKGPAVLNLWANWCGPCREEMPIIERFHQSEPGVRVIGVNTLDTQPGLAREVADRAGVTYPLVVDSDRAIASAATGLPQTLLIDASGRIVHVAPGGFSSLAELRATVKQYLPVDGPTTGPTSGTSR